MNHDNCRRTKKSENRLFGMKHFDEWFHLAYSPAIFGKIPIPKKVSFKEHIRILKEQENQYAKLLNDYNELVESYNSLQKAYCKVTGERYVEDE